MFVAAILFLSLFFSLLILLQCARISFVSWLRSFCMVWNVCLVSLIQEGFCPMSLLCLLVSFTFSSFFFCLLLHFCISVSFFFCFSTFSSCVCVRESSERVCAKCAYFRAWHPIPVMESIENRNVHNKQIYHFIVCVNISRHAIHKHTEWESVRERETGFFFLNIFAHELICKRVNEAGAIHTTTAYGNCMFIETYFHESLVLFLLLLPLHTHKNFT